MKVMSFSLRMLFKEKKKSLFYVLSCTLSVMVTFLFLNILYNENYYGGMQLGVIGDYNKILSVMLSFLVIVIVVAMNFYAYHFYLTSQTKEIGIFMLGGSSMSRLFFYLVAQNLLIYFIAFIFGIVCGCCLTPLVNLYMSHQMNISIPLFVYHPVALFGTLGITICILFYLAIVSVGFIHRHEIKELLGLKNEMRKKDERFLYIPSSFYLVIFLSPILAELFIKNPQIIAVYSFVAVLVGFKGFCRYVLPPLISRLQRHVLLEFRLGLISSGNFHQILVSSCSIFQIFILICIFMNAYMINNVDNLRDEALIFVAYVALVICVSIGIIYKILLETSQRKVTFSHLHKLGYTKKDLSKMIFQEIMALFLMIALILTLYIGAFYLPYVFDQTLNIGFAIKNMGIFMLAILLTGVISYQLYKNTVMEEIER